MTAIPARKGLTYREAGVNIDAGDEVVERIGPVLKRTQDARVLGRHGGFAGMFRLVRGKGSGKGSRRWRKPVLVGCTDGVGTKVLLAVERRMFAGIGIDCVAMNVNDLIVQGAEPLFFLDYLGLSRLQPDETAQLIESVARGCEIAGCALLGGECAEMPDIYKPGDFDIAGFCVGVLEEGKIIDPERVKRGDVVIGLASSGVHSNGYTLVRRIVRDAGLDLNAEYPELAAANASSTGQRLADVLLEPTRIYARTVLDLLADARLRKAITGMAHITGGGLPGNVCRALPSRVDVVIDQKSWDRPAIFPFLQRYGQVESEEMFRVFNMGIGYTIICRPDAASRMMKRLKRLGEKAWVIGEVVKGKGEARIG
jgi:phosphoribosylformylglycinamidine cyclo-ligase